MNLVHQDDVIAAIQMLLKLPQGGHVYNLCAPIHPTKAEFYPPLARALGLEPPQFADEDQLRREIGGRQFNQQRIRVRISIYKSDADAIELICA